MTVTESAAVELRGVSYVYRGTDSGVHDIALTIPPRAIYALVGPNGAGKTTLMRLMCGLLRADAGSVLYFGNVFGRQSLASIGTLIETPSLYEHLTGREHLRIFATYTGAPPAAIDATLETVGLSSAAHTRIRAYSLGMKQRLGVATALLHDPAIVILDEPSNGLDPEGIVALRALMLQLCDSGKTIILSSHLLGEVEKVASRVAVVRQGRVRFEGTTAELASATRSTPTIRLRVSNPARTAEILNARMDGDAVVLAGGDDAAANAIRLLVAAGIDVFEVRSEAASLERDFVTLLKKDRDAS